VPAEWAVVIECDPSSPAVGRTSIPAYRSTVAIERR